MEFDSILTSMQTNLWDFHIPVPEPIARPFITPEGDRRVVCHIDEKISFQCALMPNGKGDFFILVNKARREKLNLKVGQVVQVRLEKDQSAYGLPVPPELEELWAQDEEGSRLFHALTPGKQRTLIHWTSTVKNSEGRLLRAVVMLEHLKETGGKVNFRQLNEDLKNSRNL